MRTAFLGIGSNLGDRQSNILQALQKLRARSRVEKVSAYYDTPPMGNVAGPKFLNVAAKILTELDPQALEHFLRDVEIAAGRRRTTRLEARSIDIDLLYVDDIVRDFGGFTLPHRNLTARPFNLVPLAEIAPEFIDPTTLETVGVMAARVDSRGIVKKERSLHFFSNRQEEEPEVKLSINRVGVSGVKRILRLIVNGREATFNGVFSMVADLAPNKAGVHMSRFSELLEEATLDVLARTDQPGGIEEIVARIAREIVESQKALRADVRLRAEFGIERWTPVSGKRGEETYTLIGIAHADRSGMRRIVGVEAEGMTACPCAQLMIREHSLRELMDVGFSQADAERALDALPVATHNQRGRGSILIGTTREREKEIQAEDLVEIVENSMSSETYDLLKRSDEFFIVNKAHRNPKFVEDVVRGILAHALDVYADFPNETFIAASAVNYESIHKHDAFAEAFGTFGDLRGELRSGKYADGKTDMHAWLEERP
jgi:GTP cyclohydrolase-4